MKALRNLGLASIVVGSTLFSGCQALEDRAGQIIAGEVFPFHNNNNKQQNNNGRNYEGANQGTGEGNSRENYESGEVMVLNEFGQVYSCIALNRIGGESAPFVYGRDQFIGKTSNLERGFGNLWFYTEVSGHFGNPKFSIYNRNTGDEIGNPTENVGVSNCIFTKVDRNSLPSGKYVAVVSGQKVKNGFLANSGRAVGPYLKIVEVPFTVK